MSEVDALRERAQRCRDFAKQYATDVGQSLLELAIELERKADRLERRTNGES